MTRTAALLALVCALAVAAGLWTIGGPGQARSERRDSQRMSDIIALARHAACLREHGQAIDTTHRDCPAPARRTDPLSGDAYHVEETISGDIRVCARFENDPPPAHVPRTMVFADDTGCLTYRAGAQPLRAIPVRY
ncbi:MAG: hypothetical protein JJU42_13765 [Rhodobacteraceae bacterium]|nr:hypothetical protein [Paracoccaceae bacterium]